MKEYELIDGNYITIYTLNAEQLLMEKIHACIKRGLVRDLYDVFFLLRYVEQKPIKELNKIQNAQIVDPQNISSIILSGPIPTIKQMKEYIGQWEK